ncbi:MAG TPA: Rieske (2Fe-2S) protein, partial [Pseudonocardiaceae bacterium]
MTARPHGPTDPSRRQVLCGLVVSLLAPGALATACGGGSGGTGTTTGAGSGTGGAATTTTTTGGSGGTGGTGGALAKLSAVPVGGGVIVNSPNGMVLLVQPTAGTVKGYDPTCTHQGFTVDPPQNDVITCVKGHGSQFNAADGSVLKGPATTPLRSVNVKIE